MVDLDKLQVSYAGGEVWTPNDPNRLALFSDRFQSVFTREHDADGDHSSRSGAAVEVPQAIGVYTWNSGTASYLLDATRSKNIAAMQAGDRTGVGNVVIRLSIVMNTSSEWGVLVMANGFYQRTGVPPATPYAYTVIPYFGFEDASFGAGKTTSVTRIQLSTINYAAIDTSFAVLVFGIRD